MTCFFNSLLIESPYPFVGTPIRGIKVRPAWGISKMEVMLINQVECNAVFIPSIDAKDLYLANHQTVPNPTGYSLRKKDGTMNTHKFINSLDYSLDLIKLREIYNKVTQRKTGFGFYENEHEYSIQVINVTFNYSIKTFNQVNKNFYVRCGFNVYKSELADGVLIKDGQLIAIQLNSPISSSVPPNLLEDIFIYSEETNEYKLNRTPRTILGTDALRQEMYQHGFYCDGIHYVRFKRSSGSARVGKCLFINEALFPKIHKYDLCGLTIKEGQEVDLAALEAYISLTSSSIIDTLPIDIHNILVIDDFNSTYFDKAIVTYESGGHLISELKETEMSNSLWDGQSLIDVSLLGRYKKKGMVLLRNRFFKSCCFNTNIQQWFKDNDITDIQQLKGFTLAKNIDDVKLITTPSSVKYLKFGTLKQWLSKIEPIFGIVKYDKPPQFLGEKLVQTHYQLINTLQLSRDEIKEFLEPSLHFRKLLRNDPAVLRYFIRYPSEHKLSREPIPDKNEVVFNLMGLNERFIETKLYHDFRKKLLQSFTKNLKCGHVLVNGNYSTLLGNPIEMLQETIGTFRGESILGIGNIHSTRFDYNQILIGSRSPHVTASCVWLPNNVANKLIDRYINLSPQIVCINSINEPTLSRLSGAD